MNTEHANINLAHLEHASLTTYTEYGKALMTPDGCWDIVVMKHNEETHVLRTGLTTKAVTLEYAPGDEILAISFKPSSFTPFVAATEMRDEGVFMHKLGGNRFWLGDEALEIPDFNNVGGFVERLQKKGLIVSNEAVDALLAGQPKAMSERTLQRHFMTTTGLTYKSFTQIQRAQKAVTLLQMGRPALEVAFTLGYTDQSHLIKSLKYIMGQTPKEIGKTPLA